MAWKGSRIAEEPRKRPMILGRMEDVKPMEPCPGTFHRAFNNVLRCELPRGHRGPCQ